MWIGIVAASSTLLVGCPPSPPAACTCDLTVASIQVTQAIQDPTNGIQLVAQRGTAVRAMVGVSGASAPVTNVNGRLHVLVDGTEITPASGLVPVPLGITLTAPLAPVLTNENDTLNFELPAPSGITSSTNVTFRVDLDPAAGETNVTNNSLTSAALSFVDRTTPSLFFTSIDYTPAGAGLPSANLIKPGAGDLFVRGILPVNDGDPNLYRRGLFPTLTYGEDASGDGILDALGSDGNDLLSLLASCRQLIVDNGLGATNNTFLYGWINGNPIDGNGLGQVGGFNAFGNTEVSRGQRSYAHELTHNFGLDHNTRNLDQVGWDVGARIADNWPGNGVTGRIRPMTLFDIQTAGLLTNQAWVDVTTYNFLLASPVLARAGGPQLATTSGAIFARTTEPSQRVAVIQGIFDRSGSKLIRLEPVIRFPWSSEPSLPSDAGAYVAELTDDAGAVTQTRFDARVADDPDKSEEHEAPGFFEVMVAVDPAREISQLRIIDASGQELGSLKASVPPTVRIVSPTDGASIGERTEVGWEVADPDTPLDQVFVQVAYSPDGGVSWVPIAVDVPATIKSITFDSTQIQKSDGQGVIRVFAADGLNTVSQDVANLTPTAATETP